MFVSFIGNQHNYFVTLNIPTGVDYFHQILSAAFKIFVYYLRLMNSWFFVERSVFKSRFVVSFL